MGTHEPFVEKQFKMVNRVTYRRRNPYNTKSNKTRIVKTPGGRLVVQYLKKRASGIPCAVAGCDTKLRGIARMRQKTVSRAYGGSICHDCVRTRIVRAFLVEEQNVVKKVIKEKEAADKANTGKKKNKKKKGKKGKK